jgi:hypothetical protein
MEMQKVRIGMDGKYSCFDAFAFDANNPVIYLTGWKLNNNAENWTFCKRNVIGEPVCMLSQVMNGRVDQKLYDRCET